LKGSDAKHAFEQLKATVKKLSEYPQRGSKHAYVICRKNPLRGTETQIAKVNFKKDCNVTLHVERPGYRVIF